MTLPSLHITALQSAYDSGALTPERLVSEIYDCLQRTPVHPVWISLVPREAALQRARDIDRGSRGKLYGVPFAVKDNIDVEGLPTTAGCPKYAYKPPSTAPVVQHLIDAGAILIGKTNLDQFATGLVGTRSPYGACSSVFDPSYISGGSSSGSAVAVARGFVSFSLGTDTAGSGRVPAAFNDIVGMKPSRGLLSTRGVVPACRSLDCVSVFANNVSDAELVFEVALAFDEADPFSRAWPIAPPSAPVAVRIGIPRRAQLEFYGDTESERLYSEMIARVAGLGARIVEIDFEPFRQSADLLYGGPFVAERMAAIGEFLEEHSDSVHPVVAGILRDSAKYTASDVFKAEYRLASFRREVETAWTNFDYMLLPTAPAIYKIEDVERDPVRLNSQLGYYTNFVNLLDLCAIALPAGFRRDGLPFGVSLIAPAFHDKNLLNAAHPIEHGVSFTSGTVELPPGWIKLCVMGAHLSGQPLNQQLTSRGARLLYTARTASDYKCYALLTSVPAKPGVLRVPGFEGNGIEVEVWGLPEQRFGGFVANIPAPLSIGTCNLDNGETVKGFLCEPYATIGMPDITSFGGWRNYLASSKSFPSQIPAQS